MVLSDKDILARCEGHTHHGPLVDPLISPFRRDNLQPASVDLTLGSLFLEPITFPWTDGIELTSDHRPQYNKMYVDQYTLDTNKFVLASTVEQVSIPDDLVSSIEGKSSLARLGLFVHITAGWIDSGFRGTITLEIVNMNPNPVILRPGMRICQIAFQQLSSPAMKPYGSEGLRSKYQNQSETTTSRYAG